MPLVSVIIPTYNRAHTIARALKSVFAQTFSDYEVIVVDDGSTDNTKVIVDEFSNITFIKQENLGVSAARNSGIKASKGKYIALLDSDDEWEAHKLQLQIDYLRKNSEYKWVHTEENWIRNGVRVNKMKKHKKGGGDQFIPSLDLCLISPSTVLMEKSLFDDILFREDFTVCVDFDLWLKLLVDYPVGFLSMALINKYGGHDDQLSTQFFAMNLYRIKTIHWVLKNMELDKTRRIETQRVFDKKYAVLLKGALKHENTKLIEELYLLKSNE